MHRLSVTGTLSAGLLLGLSGVGVSDPSFQSSPNVPVMIVPLYQEQGAPSFTTPAGSGGSGATSGGSGNASGLTMNGPTSGATAVAGNGSTLTYTNGDGTTVTVSGGSLAWRDNNPGNLVYNANTAALGAIGSNEGFAVFPDATSGSAALASILNSSTYQALTVDGAISRYAPAFENNTTAYQAFVTTQLGVTGSTQLNSLSKTQMQTLQGAIQTQEGYTAGSVSKSGGHT